MGRNRMEWRGMSITLEEEEEGRERWMDGRDEVPVRDL